MKSIKKTVWTAAGLLGLVAIFALPAAADQVILDDLIVDGSLCVGFDCVNGESFGFDTIRMKENNMRIKAQDTSSTSSFPTQDWQLTFNDTSNGGQNKFSVDAISPSSSTPFTIEAGSNSHALYVDDGGRIGFGTSTPVVDLHVKSGNTPTLRLEQDGTSGFGAQTWDVAGNEANFFIRDASNGSTLPLRIFPGAPSNAITIEASTGDVGLGTTTPAQKAHFVKSNAQSILRMEATGSDQNAGINLNNTVSGGTQWTFVNSGANGNFNISGPGGAVANKISIARADGSVTIGNDLIVTGMCTGCDAVFQPEFPLESIQEHAEQMWRNSYLPAVGPTNEGAAKINVFEKTTGILQELEKAHIYIEQLHRELGSTREALGELTSRLEALEQPE